MLCGAACVSSHTAAAAAQSCPEPTLPSVSAIILWQRPITAAFCQARTQSNQTRITRSNPTQSSKVDQQACGHCNRLSSSRQLSPRSSERGDCSAIGSALCGAYAPWLPLQSQRQQKTRKASCTSRHRQIVLTLPLLWPPFFLRSKSCRCLHYCFISCTQVRCSTSQLEWTSSYGLLVALPVHNTSLHTYICYMLPCDKYTTVGVYGVCIEAGIHGMKHTWHQLNCGCCIVIELPW